MVFPVICKFNAELVRKSLSCLSVSDFKTFNPGDLLARSLNNLDLLYSETLKLTAFPYHAAKKKLALSFV